MGTGILSRLGWMCLFVVCIGVLGATLLMEGRLAGAEAVYRKDLARLPGNGWSLYGLGRALRLQGKDDEAAQVEAQFARAWEGADTPLRSSCFCQPGV